MTQRSFSANNAANLYSGSLASEQMSYDPDGPLNSYDNDETGTAFYAYNTDGTLQPRRAPK